MSTTATRERRRPAVIRPLPVVALIAGAATAFVARDRSPEPSPDASLAPDGSVSLVGLDGRPRWRVPTDSAAAPKLIAAGDVGDDGITD